MRRLVASCGLAALVATSCAGGSSNSRTVLVDFNHDQFTSYFTQYFPDRIQAHPGDTVVFRQTWTGEPHSVTMGKIVDTYGGLIKKGGYFDAFAKGGYAALPPDPPKDVMKYEEQLPWMIGDKGKATQNGSQPCYLKTGVPPKNPDQPCRKAQQKQPDFDGTYNYYNSGFIPYKGPNGDTFTLKISTRAKPGEHFFYCNYHGPFMSGFLDIKPKNVKIPSQNDVNQSARRQIDKTSKPLLTEFRRARRGTFEPPKDAVAELDRLGLIRQSGGRTFFSGNLAGLGAEHVDNGLINEFIPKRVTAKVGEKLTWVIIGDHTLSFNVPKYFPIIEVKRDGTVVRNPKIDKPLGGAPKQPEMDDEHSEGRPKPMVVDAGTWNGRTFWSTGLVWSDSFAAYSLRVSRPGTYKFACLIHPPMVGTLVVTR